MKRLFISLLLLVPVMTFAGCGAGDDSSEIDIPEVPNDPGNDDDDNDNREKNLQHTQVFDFCL